MEKLEIRIESVPGVICLADECWNCTGGVIKPKGCPSDRPDGKCGFCSGIGYRITNEGQAILAFLKLFQGVA